MGSSQDPDDPCTPKAAPESWPEAVKTAADGLSDLVRFSLKAVTWPVMALPPSLRSTPSRGIRFAVEASGVVPHAVARGVDAFADDLSGSEESGSEE